MVPISTFLLGFLFVGIHGSQFSFQAGNNGWELIPPNTSNDFSTDNPSVAFEAIKLEAAEDSLRSERDPDPSWRPYYTKNYAKIRDSLKLISEHDHLSKTMFDFFNHPSSKRTLIDIILYSADRYLKERDGYSTLEEKSTASEHACVSRDQSNTAEEANINVAELNTIPDVEDPSNQGVEADAPVEMILNGDEELLHRSGLFIEAEDFGSMDEQSSTDTNSEENYPLEETFEYDVDPLVTTDIPIKVFDASTEAPEETGHILTKPVKKRFPPIKSKNFGGYKNKEPEQEQTHYVPVSKLNKHKLTKTEEQTAHEMEVEAQAVEEALGLAEVLAREAAKFVRTITKEALRHNVDRTRVKNPHLKHKMFSKNKKTEEHY